MVDFLIDSLYTHNSIVKVLPDLCNRKRCDIGIGFYNNKSNWQLEAKQEYKTKNIFIGINIITWHFFAELIVAPTHLYIARERDDIITLYHTHTHTRESGDQSRGFARLACQKTLAITRGPFFFFLEISRLVGN